ncbi:hypothetical protein Acr_23g0014250 [Actinidia rufa]|uniref:Uncharacterized protein n=1 Tax=Actinidia rufa TaxID=165716 RepID=A0A7J0GQF1_9ERIC|nr:hypothetical protein Acr_23g0014250 [Actinidia rufa]
MPLVSFDFDAPCQFKWYVEFTGSRLDFVMFLCKSIYGMKQEEDDTQTYHHHDDDDTEFVMGHLLHAIWYQSVMWYYLDDHILKQQLENAEIADSKKHGKVRVRGERIGDFWSLEKRIPEYWIEREDKLRVLGMWFFDKVWRVPRPKAKDLVFEACDETGQACCREANNALRRL